MKKLFATLVLLVFAAVGMCTAVCAENTETSAVSPVLVHFGDKNRIECLKIADNVTAELGSENDSSTGRYIKYTQMKSEGSNVIFKLDFESDNLPSIADLSKYPIIALGYRSNAGSCMIAYGTDGYDTDNGMAYIAPVVTATNGFVNLIIDTADYAVQYLDREDSSTPPQDDDVSWSNKLKILSIAFGAPLVDLEYIGFFATEAEAEYAVTLAGMELIDYQSGYKINLPSSWEWTDEEGVTHYFITYDDDGKVSDESIIYNVKEIYYTYYNYSLRKNILYLDNEHFSVEVSGKTAPVAGTADNPNGTNGVFTVRIYLNPTDDDSVQSVLISTLDGQVVADKYFDGEVEILGTQIRKDGDKNSLRFGVKVNVGENHVIQSVTAGAVDYETLAPKTDYGYTSFGMYIVPKFAIPEGGWTGEQFCELLYGEEAIVWKDDEFGNGGYFIKGETEEQDVQIAMVYCDKIFSVGDDGFTYTAVVTDIADPDVELVVYPFFGYSINISSSSSTFITEKFYEPITRSVNDVIEALGDNITTSWDK